MPGHWQALPAPSATEGWLDIVYHRADGHSRAGRGDDGRQHFPVGSAGISCALSTDDPAYGDGTARSWNPGRLLGHASGLSRNRQSSVLDAASLEMSWVKRMWAIDRPILSRNLATAFLATAMVASGDVPATLPVIPPGVTTVGTRLFGLLHSGARYQEAALAIWYVAAITLISLFLLRNQTVRRIIK